MAHQSASSVRAWALRSSVLSLANTCSNRVEIRAVRRQVTQCRACSLNGRLDAGDLVSAQVIHHDDVTGAQLWRE